MDVIIEHRSLCMEPELVIDYSDYERRLRAIEERGWITKNGRHILIGENSGSGGKSGKKVDKSRKSDIIKLRINLFDKSDKLYVEAYSIEEEPGFEDVMLHGSPSSVQITKNGKIQNLNPSEFVDYLKGSGYKGGDIRLASCSTGQGENSFAQQLSKLLGVRVKAPDDDVFYIPDEGIMYVGSKFSNIGKWRLFDKGVEIND